MEEILYFINGKEILFWNYTFLARKKKNACYAIVLYPWTGCFKLSAAWWIPSLLSGVAINSVNVGVRLSRQRQVIWQPVGGLKKKLTLLTQGKGIKQLLKERETDTQWGSLLSVHLCLWKTEQHRHSIKRHFSFLWLSIFECLILVDLLLTD